MTPGAVGEEGKCSDGTAVARYRFLTEHAFSSPFEIRYVCSSDCGPWARGSSSSTGEQVFGPHTGWIRALGCVVQELVFEPAPPAVTIDAEVRRPLTILTRTRGGQPSTASLKAVLLQGQSLHPKSPNPTPVCCSCLMCITYPSSLWSPAGGAVPPLGSAVAGPSTWPGNPWSPSSVVCGAAWNWSAPAWPPASPRARSLSQRGSHRARSDRGARITPGAPLLPAARRQAWRGDGSAPPPARPPLVPGASADASRRGISGIFCVRLPSAGLDMVLCRVLAARRETEKLVASIPLSEGQALSSRVGTTCVSFRVKGE